MRKKTVGKIGVALLTAGMIASLSACGGNKETDTNTTTAATEADVEESETGIAIDMTEGETDASVSGEESMIEDANTEGTDNTEAADGADDTATEETTLSPEDEIAESEEVVEQESMASELATELEGVTNEVERRQIIASYAVEEAGTITVITESEADEVTVYTVAVETEGGTVDTEFYALNTTEVSEGLAVGDHVTIAYDGIQTRSLPGQAHGVYWILSDEDVESRAAEEVAYEESVAAAEEEADHNGTPTDTADDTAVEADAGAVDEANAADGAADVEVEESAVAE